MPNETRFQRIAREQTERQSAQKQRDEKRFKEEQKHIRQMNAANKIRNRFTDESDFDYSMNS